VGTGRAPGSPGPHHDVDIYGGIALGVATLAAIAVANSPASGQYRALLETVGEIRIGSIGVSKTLEHWVNDGLMAVFFLLVAIEIKRELLTGALAGIRLAALPVVAATGGFVAPALIFAAANWGDSHALRGWAIPAATDIAFAVAVLSALGRAVPASLRTFLLALAIIDDLMAIVVIAMFYTSELSLLSLLLAALGVAALAALNLCNVRARAPYVLVGIFTWVCVLKSGVHATLAGVAVGLAMPHTDRDGESMLERTEHALRPWISYGIVLVFAFANAGVPFAGVTFASLMAPIPLGVAAGLFLGKQVGVFVLSVVAIRVGLVDHPRAVSFGQLYGAAILTGIGFTMSLFIGTLAFEDESVMAQVRLGVLAGSVLSAIAGAALLIALAPRREAPAD
jgi:Na+:H+ antiporter, NhaA family